MIRTLVVTLAFALPFEALAQNEFEGLDLSGTQKPEETTEQKPAEETPPPPAAPVEKPAAEQPAAAKPKAPAVERDITQEDRVKSVQRKLYLKRYRFELAPYLGASINDPYYMKLNVAVRGAYYLADTLALSGRLSLLQVMPSEDVRTAKRTFQSRIFYSVPVWSAMGNAEWSAIYGKVAFMNSILHFDAYVLGGAGVVATETTTAERGPNIAADLGLGMRFVAKDYLAVNVALINTTYVDQPAGTTKGATQNMMMLNVGLSLFVPFKSTWREAE